jgi:hypothetical protein
MDDMQKPCSKCNQVKDEVMFRKDKTCRNGYSNICLVCSNQYHKEYEQKNADKIAKRKKSYRQRDYVKASQRNQYYRRRDAGKLDYANINEKRRLNMKRKYHEEPAFKLRVLLRTRLNEALRNDAKAGSAIRDLGCSMEFFKGYIEAQFKDGMNWNNRGHGEGKWQLDHIYPLSKVDLTNREQFLKVHHYTKYQPLWSNENRAKSNHLRPNG